MMVNSANIFDDNILSANNTPDETLTKEQLTGEMMDKLQDILVKRFPNNPQKQRIKIYPDRINFAAPCCGDSMKDNSKKRGNIILNGPFQMTYKCHNCGLSMPVYAFFKRFGQKLSLNSIDYITSHRPDTSNNLQDSSLNYLYNNELIDNLAIDREYFKQVYLYKIYLFQFCR